MVLQEVIKNNHYPIVFIGSGMSLRYLNGFQNWESLLETYWHQIRPNTDFYEFMNQVRQQLETSEQFKKDNVVSDAEETFLINTRAADQIEAIFNKAVSDGNVTVEGLTAKDIYQKRFSAFKVSLANHFSNLRIKSDTETKAEYELFQKFLKKSRMIVTTNYDQLIEKTIQGNSSEKPKVYIGQKGFFNANESWDEVYKIHGSVEDPNSIIINTTDYKNYDNNSILISAKILSSMIDSPIIFLGYSLTDRNVRKLLRDFANQLLNQDTHNLENRIIIVNFDANGDSDAPLTSEVAYDHDLGLYYTSISTNNYSKIYELLSQIDEGASPYEVRKYQKLIKKLIISAGSKGALESVLLSPTDLDELSGDIDKNKDIVIALGNTKNIFINPTVPSYLTDYILEKFEILPENALRFIARQQTNGRLPLLHHYQNINFEFCNLEPFEIQRIKDHVERDETDINDIKGKINKSNQKQYTSLANILDKEDIKLAKKIDFITYNADHLDFASFDKYVKKEALPNFIRLYKKRENQSSAEKTAYRKLFTAWDILKFKESIQKPISNPSNG